MAMALSVLDDEDLWVDWDSYHVSCFWSLVLVALQVDLLDRDGVKDWVIFVFTSLDGKLNAWLSLSEHGWINSWLEVLDVKLWQKVHRSAVLLTHAKLSHVYCRWFYSLYQSLAFHVEIDLFAVFKGWAVLSSTAFFWLIDHSWESVTNLNKVTICWDCFNSVLIRSSSPRCAVKHETLNRSERLFFALVTHLRLLKQQILYLDVYRL